MARATPPGMEYAPGKLIVGRSIAMRRVFFLVERYAKSAASVLVTGETGSGKELVARAVHHHSGRSGPFVAVNCAAVADSLFESEFFGHKRGAFTGAVTDRAGWFEQAAGGTLFLDEIGEMPSHQQARLLRAIQEQAVVPVGATGAVAVTARIVAATNVDLEAAVGEGRFRQDLLDRLQVLEIRLPPLRERQEDVPLLVRHFVGEANAAEQAQVSCRGPAMGVLVQWASESRSIRAVQNAIRRLVVLKGKGSLNADDLTMAGVLRPPQSSDYIDGAAEAGPGEGIRLTIDLAPGSSYRRAIEEARLAITDAVLERHCGNATAAARELGISKDTWYRIRSSRRRLRAAAR